MYEDLLFICLLLLGPSNNIQSSVPGGQSSAPPKFGRRGRRGRGRGSPTTIGLPPSTNNDVMMGDQPRPEGGLEAKLAGAKVGKNKPFLGIFVTFGKRMASFFNVKESQYVLVGWFGFPTLKFTDYY